jgi:signal transduction histidine kinase
MFNMGFTVPSQKSARVLIVDDQHESIEGMARLLASAGYEQCQGMADPLEVVERFGELAPDLIVLDLHMEPLSGLEVLQRLAQQWSEQTRPAVLVLTADTTPEARHDALGAGATDFLSKPFDHVEALLRIKNLLESRALYQQCQVYGREMERLVERRTAELQRQTLALEEALAELRETQQQVIRQERVRVLGTVSRGIAHDLNNGLSIILGFGDILLSDLENFPRGSKLREQLELIVAAGRDNATLVARLREFYEPTSRTEQWENMDLNVVVEQSIALTAPRWRNESEAFGVQYEIIHEDRAPLLPMAGVMAEIREVLTNLIFNALDAMPSGGRIQFRTMMAGDLVRLEVIDSGVGMTEETHRQCFEPFFTTKGADGSGLGLAMSLGIVTRHGGRIEVESSPAAGTKFTLEFPVSRLGERPIPLDLKGATEPLRVLVVDDNKEILKILAAYLGRDRHSVVVAESGTQALRRLSEGKFDLVIADRAMPRMSGDELAARVGQVNPEMPFIILTGFADVLKPEQANVDLVLSKPAGLNDLRMAIHEAFRRRRARMSETER